jgi:hypothetical protein
MDHKLKMNSDTIKLSDLSSLFAIKSISDETVKECLNLYQNIGVLIVENDIIKFIS